jgi:hypothetical protein
MGSYHLPGRRTLRPYHPLCMSIAPFLGMVVYPVCILLPSNHFESLTRLSCFLPCLLLRRLQQGCDNVRRRATRCDDVRQRATTCDDVRQRATTCGPVLPLGFLQAGAYDASQQHPRDFKTQACPRRATDHRLFPLGFIIVACPNPRGILFTWPIPRGISCAPVPCNFRTTSPTSWRNVPATGRSGASPN